MQIKEIFLIFLVMSVVFSFVDYEPNHNQITGNSISWTRTWKPPFSGYDKPRPSTCFDDYQLDYFKKDVVMRKGILSQDECSENGKYVYEKYCTNSNGYVRTKAHICPNGCSEGACI